MVPRQNEHAVKAETRERFFGRGGREKRYHDVGQLVVVRELGERLPVGRSRTRYHEREPARYEETSAGVVAKVDDEVVDSRAFPQAVYGAHELTFGGFYVVVEKKVADPLARSGLYDLHVLDRTAGHLGRSHAHRARLGRPEVEDPEPVFLADGGRIQPGVYGGRGAVYDIRAVHFQYPRSPRETGRRGGRTGLDPGHRHFARGRGFYNREPNAVSGGNARFRKPPVLPRGPRVMKVVLLRAGGCRLRGFHKVEVLRRGIFVVGGVLVVYLVVPQVGFVTPGSQPVFFMRGTALPAVRIDRGRQVGAEVAEIIAGSEHPRTVSEVGTRVRRG